MGDGESPFLLCGKKSRKTFKNVKKGLHKLKNVCYNVG